MAIFDIVRFWLLVVFLIPSIICSVFGLYHLLVDRALRQALHNHVVIIILLFCFLMNMTVIAWRAYNYGTNQPILSTRTFCLIWHFLDYIGFLVISLLVAWASIERHILIFHDKWLIQRRKRFLLHYFPLIILIFYSLIFYIVVFFILPCNHEFDYSQIQCGYNFCPFRHKIISKWESLLHNVLPAFIIGVFNSSLLLRVLCQKRRLHRKIQWRNYRKMIIQMLSVSSLFFALYLAPMSLYAAYSFGVSRQVASGYYETSSYFYYFMIVLLPFINIMSLPELRKKFKLHIRRREQAIQHINIHQVLPINQQVIHRPVTITPAN